MVPTQTISQTMADELARSFQIEPDQAQVVVDHITPEFTWALEERTLSRGGLADLMDVQARTIHHSVDRHR